MISGGENNVDGDTLTFDGDIFGGGADLTCQVAKLENKLEVWQQFTGNPTRCVSLMNNGVYTDDDNKYYRLSGERTLEHCVDWAAFTVAQVTYGLGVVLQQVETQLTKHL